MSSPMTFDPRITEFCTTLAALESGDRARFKRNAGRDLSASHRVLGLFYRKLPRNVPRYDEDIYFLVATLYPLNTLEGRCGNFGDSLRLAREPRGVESRDAGLDRRVEVLLDADRDQLGFRLRQLVAYVESKRVPVNWRQFLKDLLAWDHPSRYVQENWARAYFAGPQS